MSQTHPQTEAASAVGVERGAPQRRALAPDPDALEASATPTRDRASISCGIETWRVFRYIQRHEVLYVAGMCCLAGIILGIYCTWLWSKGDAHFEGDQLDYKSLARGILQQGRLHHSFRPPLYPFLLSVSYAVLGVNDFAGLSLQCVLGVGNCLVLYLVARRLCGSAAAAVALAGSTFYYYYFKHCGFYMTEPLYSLLLGLATLAGLRAIRDTKARAFLLFGLVLGLSALARPTSLALLPVAACWPLAALVGRPRSSRALCGAVVVAGFLLPVAPWTMRDYSRLGGPVPICTNAGFTFIGANNPVVLRGRSGTWVNPHDTGLLSRTDLASVTNEVTRDRLCWRAALGYLKSNPRDALQLGWLKFVRFWHFLPLPGECELLRRLAWLQYLCVFFLASYGAVLCRGRWRELFFVYGTIVTYCAIGVIFNPGDRHRCPIEPFLVIFAAWGIRCLIAHRPWPLSLLLVAGRGQPDLAPQNRAKSQSFI